MKIVGPIRHIVQTFPGHDCMFTTCQHGVPGDHGIKSEEDIIACLAELEDGRNVALTLTLSSGRYPATVPAWWLEQGSFVYPRAKDLSLHVQQPRDSKTGVPCTWFGDGGRCLVRDTTALGASEMFAGFGYDIAPHPEGFDRVHREPAERWHAEEERLGHPRDKFACVWPELWERMDRRLVKLAGEVAG